MGLLGLALIAPARAAGDTSAPSKPSGFAATVSGSTVNVTWNASSDNVGVAGYRLYRDGFEIGQSSDQSPADVLAVGDIALCNNAAMIAGHTAVANLLASRPGTIFTLGDTVQGNGSAASFANCFDPAFGSVKNRIRPAIGNHEYNTGNGAPYWDYFGAAAGPRFKGWYTVTEGPWKIIVLNTNCWELAGGSCNAGGEQYEFLKRELRTWMGRCTAVVAHHPKVSARRVDDRIYLRPMFQLMLDHGVDVMLSGDDHVYERYPKINNRTGTSSTGVRQFIAATGGFEHRPLGTNTTPRAESRNNTAFGVLDLDLRADGYSWKFVPEPGQNFTDQGTTPCHGPNAANLSYLDLGVNSNRHSYTLRAYDAAGNVSAVAGPVVINGAAGGGGGGAVTPPAAGSISVTSSTADAGVVDRDRNGTGDWTFGAGNTHLDIGEQVDGHDQQLVIPFDLSPAQVAEIAATDKVELIFTLTQRSVSNGASVDLDGLVPATGSTPVARDYQAGAVKLRDRLFTPSSPMGRKVINITKFAKNNSSGGRLTFRFELDKDAARDGTRHRYTLAMANAGNTSVRPVLRIN